MFRKLVAPAPAEFSLTECSSCGLTIIRRENPAFNYGFFRPNPLACGGEAGENARHGSDFTGRGSPEQAEIARSGPQCDPCEAFQHPYGTGIHRLDSTVHSHSLPRQTHGKRHPSDVAEST